MVVKAFFTVLKTNDECHKNGIATSRYSYKSAYNGYYGF